MLSLFKSWSYFLMLPPRLDVKWVWSQCICGQRILQLKLSVSSWNIPRHDFYRFFLWIGSFMLSLNRFCYTFFECFILWVGSNMLSFVWIDVLVNSHKKVLFECLILWIGSIMLKSTITTTVSTMISSSSTNVLNSPIPSTSVLIYAFLWLQVDF